MKVLREQMQDDINSVSKQVHGIKAQLEALDRDNQQARNRPARLSRCLLLMSDVVAIRDVGLEPVRSGCGLESLTL